MRYILIILVFISVGAKAQMVIKAHANYRPYASPAANLLLDDYPNAAAAYSLRKLRTAYSGSAIRVRKDTTGQPEQDISFDASGNLDTAQLKQFLNLRSGFVTTWYDQSGNGYNATQATSTDQPRIALTGTIQRQGSNPTVFFASDHLTISSTFADLFETQNNNISAFAAVKSNSLTASNSILSIAGNDNATAANNDYLYFFLLLTSGDVRGDVRDYVTVNTTKTVTSNPNTLSTNFGLASWIRTSSNGTAYANNNGGTAADQTLPALLLHHANIGRLVRGSATTLADQFAGNISELIIYESDATTNRTGIATNINSYYSIY